MASRNNQWKLWDKRDIEILVARYSNESTELISKDLNRSMDSVWRKASSLGLKKSKEAIAESSHLSQGSIASAKAAAEKRARKSEKVQDDTPNSSEFQNWFEVPEGAMVSRPTKYVARITQRVTGGTITTQRVR